MSTVTFYPVGNGDTSLIQTSKGKMILMDYFQNTDATHPDTPTYNIAKALKQKLDAADRNSFDVVAFTHADRDHINGSTDFFYLEFAKKYQDDNRIHIDELWVPAAILLESTTRDKQSDEFVTWRNEARYRLKNKLGIKVFSLPDDLKTLIESWEMTVDELSDHIIDAGTVVDTFSLAKDDLEFFVHAPFMKHCNDAGDDIKKVRNEAALIFNVRFNASGSTYDYLAVGDSEAHVLEDVLDITKYHHREDRLRWDLFNIPHHCSYLALADEKGDKETEPLDKLKELLLMGNPDCYLICSSEAFLTDRQEAEKKVQPPHIQARRCYERYLTEVHGRAFKVTGEHGGTKHPQPLVVMIERAGISIKDAVNTAAMATATAKPARAG